MVQIQEDLINSENEVSKALCFNLYTLSIMLKKRERKNSNALLMEKRTPFIILLFLSNSIFCMRKISQRRSIIIKCTKVYSVKGNWIKMFKPVLSNMNVTLVISLH